MQFFFPSGLEELNLEEKVDVVGGWDGDSREQSSRAGTKAERVENVQGVKEENDDKCLKSGVRMRGKDLPTK